MCALPQPVLGLQQGLRRSGDSSMTMTGMGPQTPYGAHGFPNCGNVRSLGGPCSKKPVVLQAFCSGRDLSNIHGLQLSTAHDRPVKPPGKARAVLCITNARPVTTRIWESAHPLSLSSQSAWLRMSLETAHRTARMRVARGTFTVRPRVPGRPRRRNSTSSFC